AVFAGDLLPSGLALVAAERDGAALDRGREQDAPLVFRHADEVELGPALAVHADRRAQVYEALLEALGAHILPPADVAGVPGFERLAHAPVRAEADVVRDEPVVVDVHRVGHGRPL